MTFPAPAFLPGESRGRRSLVGCSQHNAFQVHHIIGFPIKKKKKAHIIFHCIYTIFSSSICPSMDIQVVSLSRLLSIILLRTWKYLYIFGIMISFLFGYTPTGGIALPYSSSSFNLRNLDAVFHSGCTSLHSHLQCIRISSSSHPHQHLPLIFLIVGVLIGAR